MSSDTPEDPAWGSPQPGRKWTTGHTWVTIGIAAVIAAFGGAAIYAATSGHSNAMGPGGFGPGPGGPDVRRLSATGPADALHGEFVVAQNGRYTTELVQTGVVTAVSDMSITARSEDGFTQTYTLSPGSPPANAVLAVDDTVTIRATKTDGALTATMVTKSDDAVPVGPHR